MFKVFFVSSDNKGEHTDGETLATFDNERDAIAFAERFWNENEERFDPMCGGAAIADENGNIVEW